MAVPGGCAGGQSDGGGESDALHKAALRIQSRYRGYCVRKVPSWARLQVRSARPALPAFGSAPPAAAVFTRNFASSARALLFTAGIEVQPLRFGLQAYQTYKLGGGGVTDFQYSPALFGVDLSGGGAAPRPRARSNAQMAIAGDTLWLLGGTVEVVPPPHCTSHHPDWRGVHVRLCELHHNFRKAAGFTEIVELGGRQITICILYPVISTHKLRIQFHEGKAVPLRHSFENVWCGVGELMHVIR